MVNIILFGNPYLSQIWTNTIWQIWTNIIWQSYLRQIWTKDAKYFMFVWNIYQNVVLYLLTHICFQTLTLSRTTFFSFTPHQHHNQNESSSTAIGCSTSSSPAYGCSLTWFFNVFARARNVISQIFHWAEFPPNFTLSANFLLMRRISKSNKDTNWIVFSLICSFDSSQSN